MVEQIKQLCHKLQGSVLAQPNGLLQSHVEVDEGILVSQLVGGNGR